MKKLKTSITLVLLLAGKVMFAQPADAINQYIQKYKDFAIEEMKRSGVPASITLAQGIHETSAGQSELVLKSNNHFGIKCKSNWTGESVSHDDDAAGECFRKYPSASESYKDHSDFLRNNQRYASLFSLDPTDFEAWAWGLKKAGYATNPKYPQLLIRLINEYNLQEYTLIAMGRKQPQNEVWVRNSSPVKEEAPVATPAVYIETKKKEYPNEVFKINRTNVVFVPKGTSYLAVAQQYRIPLTRIFEFNDLQPQEEAAEDGLVYLQRKRKTGANDVHTVAPGENLYTIAQAEGIRLESLLDFNHLQEYMQPKVGEVLYLSKKAPAMPQLASATAYIRSESSSNSMAKARVQEEASEFELHTVQTKETLYAISKKYMVSVEDIVKWNNLEGTDLKIGQQLRIKKK